MASRRGILGWQVLHLDMATGQMLEGNCGTLYYKTKEMERNVLCSGLRQSGHRVMNGTAVTNGAMHRPLVGRPGFTDDDTALLVRHLCL